MFTFKDGKILLKNAFRKARPNLPAARGRAARARAWRPSPARRTPLTPARASRRYDPRYDPLVAADPGAGRAYAPTYWVATAGAPPDDDGPIAGDVDADVVVIGSGSTGISTALYLAQEHGVRAVVLEANQAAVGLLQPQRRTGAERERAAEALAMDRALGPGRRASSSTPRSAPASRTSRR